MNNNINISKFDKQVSDFILSRNKPNQKYIVCRSTGLNEVFAVTATTINVFGLLNMDLNNLYFTHSAGTTSYEDLNHYFNFKKIKYINYEEYKKNAKEFVWIPSQFAAYTNINWGTPYHISNFVSYKDHVLEEAQKYASPIGVHFRLSNKESFLRLTPERQKDKQHIIEEQILGYKTAFLKIYDDKNKYFCASDSNEIIDFLQKYPNIQCVNNKKNSILPTSHNTERRDNTKEAVLELASLSLCNFVYYTVGKFTELALALKPNLKQTPLFYLEERSIHQKQI